MHLHQSTDKVGLRILRVIARLNVGGPARHVVWLTAGLKERGHDAMLVTGSVPAGEQDMSFFAAAHGIEPWHLPEMSRELTLKDLLAIWRLYRLYLQFRPDIVHTHTAKGGATGRIAGLMYRWLTPSVLWGRPRPCRFVHTFHGHIFHSYYGFLKTSLFRSIERLLALFATDRIITISPQQFQEIHHDFRVGRADQFSVIPLGLDTDVFADWPKRRGELREQWGAGPGDMFVGIVGRLAEIKNHALFLQAIALYQQANPPRRRVRFLVIGDGHLRAALEEQSRALGIDQHVTFVGQRNDPEYFYPALDIVALTSLNEGTPLTLLEAMANARPVVATGVGGVADVLGEPRGDETAAYSVRQRGILVPSKDAAAFAQALARLVDDEELRRDLGKSGEAFVLQNNSKDRLINDIEDLYRDLVRRPRLQEAVLQQAPATSVG
jgi:glycosyltransferase involved in cell wall biosynthesis